MFNILKFLSRKKQKSTYPSSFIDVQESLDFQNEVFDMVHKTATEKNLSDRHLSKCDGYTLEFGFPISPYHFVNMNRIIIFDFTVFNGDLDVVYNLADGVFNVISLRGPIMEQSLKELKYWLSLDW